jgi:hypothetical protein
MQGKLRRRTLENDKKDMKEMKVQIDLDEATAQGAYCNFAIVNHTDSEFVVDSIYLQPMQPKAKVRSRVIMTPKHAKKLMNALAENIKRYEENFGVIPDDVDGLDNHDLIH